jgi:predicted O-linked N-acetylglucosamine transferase (SPINDLY family)
MTDNLFLSALQRITAGNFSLGELIETAAKFTAADQRDLSRQLYKVWIKVNPNDPLLFVALFNCAELDDKTGDRSAAIDSLIAAIAARPDFAPAHINLGGLLERAGAPNFALDQWKAVANQPAQITGETIDYAITALKQTARVLNDHKINDGAEAAIVRCLDIDRKQPDVIAQHIAIRLGACKWPIMEPVAKLDRKALLESTHPLSMTWYTDDPLLQLATAERYVRQQIGDPPKDWDGDRRNAPIDLSNRRLRVGYVSSDLRDHAIGYLMTELFELHDRKKVEVFAYYCGSQDAEGGLSSRIKDAVEHWVDIRAMNDDDAARRIAADGIDILVDVNGHTKDSRTLVFARRPAPIQVNWLGFPGSMGTTYHHYMIADEWIVPPESEMYFAEKTVRLPCYQPNDRKRPVAGASQSRADAGLPDDAFVFCCFNGSQKYSKFTFDRFIEILKGVPNGVLWLIDTSEEAKLRLWAYAEKNGVAKSRIVFAQKLQNAFHLARYEHADLFLDTAPYGAHTTASDALWMGVPVLTLSGRSFAARVCGSLVRAAGLPELICQSPQEFVARAIALGRNRAEVDALKARLKANRDTCTLFDMDTLTERLEGLYLEMCDDYANGRLPRPDLANLPAYFEAGIEHQHELVELQAVNDYHERYKAELARIHRIRPIAPDNRIWGAADIAKAEGTGKASVTPIAFAEKQRAPAPKRRKVASR